MHGFVLTSFGVLDFRAMTAIALPGPSSIEPRILEGGQELVAWRQPASAMRGSCPAADESRTKVAPLICVGSTPCKRFQAEPVGRVRCTRHGLSNHKNRGAASMGIWIR